MRCRVLIAALLLAGAASARSGEDPFAAWLEAPFPPADGFDLPVGDGEGGGAYTGPDGRRYRGWYVATSFGERYALGLHPAEDWNGRGGGNTDAGQPVYAMGAGRVVAAAVYPQPFGGLVAIDHLFYESHVRRVVRSVYAHLGRIDVSVGETVTRRQVIGTVGQDPAGTMFAHLHFEVRTDTTLPLLYWPSADDKDLAWIEAHYVDPRAFIRARRRLPVPQSEPRLVLVHHDGYRMRLYEGGRLAGEWEIGLGQGRGEKRRRGDLKTPRGMYFVVERMRGEIGGEYGAYYGGHWIKVSYPNPWDAAPGRALVTPAQRRAIEKAWARRGLPPQNTRLGSGIGFHGWRGEWDGEGGAHLSWGCVVMHNRDIAAVYDRIPPGTMVVLF